MQYSRIAAPRHAALCCYGNSSRTAGCCRPRAQRLTPTLLQSVFHSHPPLTQPAYKVTVMRISLPLPFLPFLECIAGLGIKALKHLYFYTQTSSRLARFNKAAHLLEENGVLRSYEYIVFTFMPCATVFHLGRHIDIC